MRRSYLICLLNEITVIISILSTILFIQYLGIYNDLYQDFPPLMLWTQIALLVFGQIVIFLSSRKKSLISYSLYLPILLQTYALWNIAYKAITFGDRLFDWNTLPTVEHSYIKIFYFFQTVEFSERGFSIILYNYNKFITQFACFYFPLIILFVYFFGEKLYKRMATRFPRNKSNE